MDINDPTVTAGLLDAAKAAHAAGVQRHQEATARWGRARVNHEATAAQRQRTLDRAANGETVTEADLERATIATRAALDSADLHGSLRDGALRVADGLEIALLQTVVLDHSARTRVAQQEAITAAEAVDAAVNIVRGKLETYQTRLADLRALNSESVQHNTTTLTATRASNRVLAGLHASQRPRMIDVPAGQAALSVVILANGRPGQLDGARIVHSVGQHASGLAPRTPTPPPAAPAPAQASATSYATPAVIRAA